MKNTTKLIWKLTFYPEWGEPFSRMVGKSFLFSKKLTKSDTRHFISEQGLCVNLAANDEDFHWSQVELEN